MQDTTVKQTQKSWVVLQLQLFGAVSRNDALNKHITRLGALIWELRDEGMNIKGGYQKTLFGKDYIYYLEEQK